MSGSNQALANEIQSFSSNDQSYRVKPILGAFTKPFDRIKITYTDDTKETISTIQTYANSVLQETLTNSSTAMVDDFARS